MITKTVTDAYGKEYTIFGPFQDIAEIMAAHQGNWFDEDTMAFWDSRIESVLISERMSTYRERLWWGRFFITSERNFDGSQRLYSIRVADDEGDISTWGEFQGYETLKDAWKAVVAIGRDA